MCQIQSLSFCNTENPSCSETTQSNTKILAITLMVIAILGIAYTVCGYTSLSKTYAFFKPLGSMSSSHLSLMLTASTALGIVGTALLVCIHRTPQEYDEKTSSIIHRFEKACHQTSVNEQHKTAIQQCLEKGFTHSLSHYDFYYHLASTSEYMLTQERTIIEDWKTFLQQLHGLKIHHQERDLDITLDCSMELMRLDGKKPQFIIEQLQTNSSTLDEDLMAMHQICTEAFSEWSSRCNTLEKTKKYFTRPNRTTYLIRSETQKILGLIVLEDRKNGHTTELFLNSLARSAHVAKLGLTKQLSEHFKQILDRKKYSGIYCSVDIDNKPAQYIYKSLGFRVFCRVTNDNTYLMEYKPDE